MATNPSTFQVGLNFMTYESVRQYLTPEGDKNPSPYRKLLAGAISGAVAQTCTYPLYVAPISLEENPKRTANRSVVTSYAGVSRSTPCPEWATNTNPSGMRSE